MGAPTRPVRLPPRPAGYRGLMELMARQLQVDLGAAQEAGLVCSASLTRMMQHCAACSDDDDCVRRLFHAPHELQDAPDYCPNRKLFHDIAAHLEALAEAARLEEQRPDPPARVRLGQCTNTRSAGA